MRPLKVDLLPSRPRSMIVPILLTLAGAAVAAYQWLEVRHLDRQLHIATARAYSDQASKSRSKVASPEKVEAMPYLDDARMVVALAAFDWAGNLKALESIREPGVKVTSAIFDAQERSIRIEVEFMSAGQIKAVLSGLNAGQPTTPWRLVRAQHETAGKPATASIEWAGAR